MERKDKRCWNCANYKAFYTKGLCHFDRTDTGYCLAREKVEIHNGICERWREGRKKTASRKNVSLRALDEIIKNIAEIRQILYEEKNNSGG